VEVAEVEEVAGPSAESGSVPEAAEASATASDGVSDGASDGA
jgi:hypothetical protein